MRSVSADSCGPLLYRRLAEGEFRRVGAVGGLGGINEREDGARGGPEGRCLEAGLARMFSWPELSLTCGAFRAGGTSFWFDMIGLERGSCQFAQTHAESLGRFEVK